MTQTLGRAGLVVILTPYVAWLTFAYDYHFVDGANLALHEGGHLVFAAFGQTLQVLGGTIGQLFFPIACAASFLHRKQIFEAAVCGVWAAESLMYTARYMGDAQAQVLPLVGGHLHDWNYLLYEAGLLGSSEALGSALHLLASVLAAASLLVAMTQVKPSKSEGETPS